MITKSFRLEDLERVKICIGYVGENEHTQVRIDCSSAFAEYPGATPALAVKPPRGGVYPAVIETEGNVVVWTVTNSDLLFRGEGEIQFSFTLGDVIKKTAVGKFDVHRSIITTANVPDPVAEWLVRATAAAAAAEAAAQHQPKIESEYWYVWDSDAEEYVSTGVKAKGDKGDPGTPGDPTTLIDDTSTALDKTWSAHELDGLKNALTSVENTLDGVLTTSENFFDGTFVNNEQVATSTGAFIAGNGAMRTGYIAITSGVVTVGIQKNSVEDNKIIRCFCFYNAQKGKVESGFGMNYTVYTADDMKYQQITVPQNAVYFAFDASMSHYENDNFYVSQEPYPDGYVPYSSTKNKVKPTSIKVDKHLSQSGLPADAKVVGDKFTKAENAITAMRGGNLTTVKAASLAAGEGLYSVRSSIIRNKTLIFNAKVTGSDWSLVLAHGVVDNSYDSSGASGGYLVTPTTATIWVNGNNGESGTLGTAWTHGLTITDRLTVIISVDNEQKQTITLMSESGFATKSYTAQFNGRKGKVYAKAITGTFTNAELSFGCSDLEKPVWIFGDSYVSLVEERYPYWLQQAHFDNCLINSYAGEATPNAILDFRSLITMATPKYIVWGLGMNDHDTSSAVNADWMDGVNELIETCKSAGITLILATIPNVVNTSCNNVKKNAWIAASGYRYVDFNKAIGAADEPGAAWPAGWLSNDNVHPTEMGARVLAGQIMLDVPELMMP